MLIDALKPVLDVPWPLTPRTVRPPIPDISKIVPPIFYPFTCIKGHDGHKPIPPLYSCRLLCNHVTCFMDVAKCCGHEGHIV